MKEKIKISRQKYGKYAELKVATELLKNQIPVYFPFVDDEKIDFVVRIQDETRVRHYDIQVKSVRGYNRILGVPWEYIATKPQNYLLVIAYIHQKKQDEFFFLTIKDLLKLMPKLKSKWRDLIFNKPEREKYKDRTITKLVNFLIKEVNK